MSEPNTIEAVETYGLTSAQWAHIWAAVHFVVQGTTAAADAFDALAPGELPEFLRDDDFAPECYIAALFHRHPDVCGLTLSLDQVDRDSVDLFGPIAAALGLTVLARFSAFNEQSNGNLHAYATGDCLSVTFDASTPDWCDDESDANITLTFQFGTAEARVSADEVAVGRINAEVVAIVRENLANMPGPQAVCLVGTLTNLVADVRKLAP